AISRPITTSDLPRSFMTPSLFKERALPRSWRWTRRQLSKMSICLARDAPAAGLAGDEADLQQIGLDDLGQRLGVVVDGGGDGLDAHRSTTIYVDDGLQEAPVELVETARVDALALERLA